MRRLLLAFGALVVVAFGSAGAGAWWYTARTFERWPILVQQSNGNLLLADQFGKTRPLTTDADGQTLSYLFATPAPDGRSVATVAVRNSAQDPSAALMVHRLAGPPITLYDEAGSSPFYLSWSPDSQKLAFLASSETGMTLHAVSSSGGETSKRIAPGQPSYFAWAPNSDRMILHIGGGTPLDGLFLYEWGANKPTRIKATPALFNAPSWLPNGEAAIVALQQPSGATLATVDTQGTIVQRIADLHGGTLFVPSPDASQIAYIALAGNIPGQLHVVRSDGSDDRSFAPAPTFAFFWSPQGDKLAFLSFDEEIRAISTRQEFPAVRWNVLTLATGKVQPFEPFQPSINFINLLPYFDQYAQSIRLWNASGTQLLYESTNGVHTLDVTTGQEQRVSDGVMGMWMEP